MTADTKAQPSVRPSLLTCMAVSLLALWIAAIEMPMTDLPTGLVFLLLPPSALAFVACGLWSAFLLTRVRRHGLRRESPPDDKLREAIQLAAQTRKLDCFVDALLAMKAERSPHPSN